MLQARGPLCAAQLLLNRNLLPESDLCCAVLCCVFSHKQSSFLVPASC